MVVSRFLILLIAAAFLGACDENQTKMGIYRYTAFLNNSPIVQGFIHLDSLSNGNVRGRWELNFVGAASNDVGPQVGTGTFEGTLDGEVLSINLNPEMADNNVFLQGTFQGDTIRGEWNFSGFAGVISQGTFLAERQ